MNKKLSLGWVICIIFLTITLTFLVTWQVSQTEFNKNLSTLKLSDDVAKKVTEIEGIIKAHYIEDLSEEKLEECASDGFVAALGDKYAQYYTKAEYEKSLIEANGKFSGIGLAIKIQTGGYITITDVYVGSPAEKAGIKIGDSITKIDGVDILTFKTDEINEKISGKEGDTFNFTTLRNGEEIDHSLIRTQFDMVYVQSEMLEGNIGYIRISSFNEKTPQQFKKSLKELTDSGAVAFIFDVRNNGGGTVDSIVGVLDPIIPEGVIVSSKDKSGKETILGRSDAEEINLPIVVLANSNTASAAELFCAAIRDYAKGEIVGMNTYGKGVMQETFVLSDGSAIKLTTAKYYGPKGENYDKVGIKPDYEITQTADEQLLIFGKDKGSDAQLQKARDVITAKTVNEVPDTVPEASTDISTDTVSAEVPA